MEVTGIMRQTVENALTSVSQVNLLSLGLSARIDYGMLLKSDPRDSICEVQAT